MYHEPYGDVLGVRESSWRVTRWGVKREKKGGMQLCLFSRRRRSGLEKYVGRIP
jgi:hypothetical protein